jgi:anaerobic selenocysteine-containing dehydrogenase/ferredoxin
MKLEKNQYRAACRGCHGGCVHILTVEEGKVTKIQPDPDAPLNKGKACTKGISIIEQMYHPDRITYPMRRVGPRGNGTWERISWDEAYDTIAEKLGTLIKEHGPECISMFTGTGRHHMAHFWRFSHVLGTPNAASSGPLVCLNPRVHSGWWTAGAYASVDYFGPKKPGGILVWGSNPAISGADGELQWFIKDAVKRETPLIVVDVRPTELTEKATLWLKIRPGTDGALALGIMNIIISEGLYDKEFVENWTFGFEELKSRCAGYDLKMVSRVTWIPEDQILEAAHMIASIKPMSLEWGCSIEQTINAIQTCRSIFMLMGITGNYDVPGGFVESQQITTPAEILTERISEDMRKKCLSAGMPYTSSDLMAHPRAVLKAMKDSKPYKIRGLLVNANNTLLSMPDSKYVYECLKEIEFMVYMDFFMNPTAEFADIFLPAALWPELDELFCMPEFSEQVILCMQKVVQVGECKSDEDFYFELSRRMGLDYGANSLLDIYNDQLAEMGRRRPEFAKINFEKFKELSYLEPRRKYYNYKERGGFDTPSGKFELFSNAIDKLGGDPLPFFQELTESPLSRPDMLENYPLVLTTGGRKHQYFISNNRQIKSLRKQAPFPLVSIHPETAAKYGIADGDWVFIETPRGKITQKATLLNDMNPKVINCEMGWWYPEAGRPGYGYDESNANILTMGDGPYDPFFGSYQLRGLLCNISKNENCIIEERYYNSKYAQTLPIDNSSNRIVLDPNKCVLCGECVEICPLRVLEIITRDGSTFVAPRNVATIAESGCVGCGKCASICPKGGIRIKPNSFKL